MKQSKKFLRLANIAFLKSVKINLPARLSNMHKDLKSIVLLFTEAPKERPRLQLQARTTEKKEGEDAPAAAPAAAGSSSVFGGAKPVDTAKKEAEMERRAAEREEKRKADLEKDMAKPKSGGGASIFGQAKPIDTRAREQEVEVRPAFKRMCSCVGKIHTETSKFG